MSFTATVTIQQEDNWFVAKCLENSVASQGKTIDEAIKNLKEALELYFEDYDEAPPAKKFYITTLEVAI
ncbi:MAG: type II toxin-antitoxin system HicB family antitoxin [Defluviitaleaceae bacterium]|nr:type II toxin-antitoxin system HicB family antitoxin [Defluviitaleaceae bacterium]